MIRVSEQDFVRFINQYRRTFGEVKPEIDMTADPPIVTYIDIKTGKVIGRYPEVSLGQGTTYKDAYFEIIE